MHSTYNGWKLKGRVVAEGERGLFRNEYGDFMFHRSQTVKLPPKYHRNRNTCPDDSRLVGTASYWSTFSQYSL